MISKVKYISLNRHKMIITGFYSIWYNKTMSWLSKHNAKYGRHSYLYFLLVTISQLNTKQYTQYKHFICTLPEEGSVWNCVIQLIHKYWFNGSINKSHQQTNSHPRLIKISIQTLIHNKQLTLRRPGYSRKLFLESTKA